MITKLEFGWFLSRWVGYLRHQKMKVYPDHKFLLMTNLQYHPIVDDFISYTIDLPDWFKKLNLETDCYEAPLPNSPPGSLTPPDVYANLIKYLREFYNKENSIEIFPPRGYNLMVDNSPQLFGKLKSDIIKKDKPIICVFPRGRTRASNRNVPEFVWKETVDKLSKDFIVVLDGTPSGSFLADYPSSESVINQIPYSKSDKLEITISYLNSAICSLSSQSGTTHLSLACDCPSYIIGHEKERHTVKENRLNTPTSFRYVQDYRMIDSYTILDDIHNFMQKLKEAGYGENPDFNDIIKNDIGIMNDLIGIKIVNRPSLRTLTGKKELVGAEIGVDRGKNAENILDTLDIKKLYLIDPYAFYNDMRGAGCNNKEESNINCKIDAHNNLQEYENRIVWVEKTSEDAVNDILEPLDFIYVDGNHRYEFVKKDIKLYSKLVKKGGLIGGHDYDYGEVAKAVNEIFSKVNIARCNDENQEITDWWTIKGGINE